MAGNKTLTKSWDLERFKRLIGVSEIVISETSKTKTLIWDCDLFGEQYKGFCSHKLDINLPMQVVMLEDKNKKVLVLCNAGASLEEAFRV